MQKGLLEQQSLTHSCNLETQGLEGTQLTPSFLRASTVPIAKSGRLLISGLCLKVGGCLLTALLY